MLLLLVFPALSGLLVNEVYYDPDPDSDDGNEWIELCNNGTEVIDLAGYWIESGGASFGACFDIASGSIAPGEYVLVGGPSTTHPGAFDPNLQNGGSETDGVRVVDPTGAVVDTVLYDTDNRNNLVDDQGLTTSAPAPDVPGGHSIGRWPDCADTDVSGVDFIEYDPPSPGAANPEPEPDDTGDTGSTGGPEADCTLAGWVTINELMPNPDGAGSDEEWIELHNSGTEPVNLEGWLVEWDTSDWETASDFTFEAGTTISAGGFLVVGYGGIAVPFSMGDAGSSADGVRIRCGDAAVDTVVYGSGDVSDFTDDTGELASSLAPKPSDGVALARFEDGVDTNQSAVDFVYASEATPGSANKVPHCYPEGGEGIKVNELMFDPSTDDSTTEWVELYNAGTTLVQLEGFVVEAGKSSWKVNATLPADLPLAPGEFLVVGAGEVPEQDVIASSLDLGNGTDGDGVRVLDCEGLVLDTVLYGETMDDGLEGDGGATDVVDDPGTGRSTGRYPDGSDNDLHTDWFPYDDPTPGAPNADPGAVETGDTNSGKDGGSDGGGGDDGICGPASERPDGGAGCASSPVPLASLSLGLGSLLALRRRR